MAQEEAAVGETGLGAEEGKSPRLMEFDQPSEEQAAEEHAQHPHRQEEGRTRRYPAPPIERDAAARHDHVDMRMVRHRRSPSVEHGGDADAGTEVLRVSRDRHHRLRCCAEQQIVDDSLVLPGDVRDLGGKREDDMEVADRQQVGLALGQPGARGGALALGAVPVAAANGPRPLAALWADPVMGSWRRLDRLLCPPPPILLTITRDAGGVRSACRTAGTRRAADVVERSIP